MLFFNKNDLQYKLDRYKIYYNSNRAHWPLNTDTPNEKSSFKNTKIVDINNFKWGKYSNVLYGGSYTSCQWQLDLEMEPP